MTTGVCMRTVRFVGEHQSVPHPVPVEGDLIGPARVDHPRELAISTQPEANNRVRVAVQDSGPGIDPQLADRVFEAFYTTKRSGMGMGLSISRSIVEQHGGRLWAVPNDGPGTTFHFTV
jgi:signal transduction histidine kinase